MLFNSYEFILVFLPVALAGAVLFGKIRRFYLKLWISVASLAFYAHWSIDFVAILIGSISVNYLLARTALRTPSRSGLRDAVIFFGVALNLCLLGWFKYAGFLTVNLNAVAGTSLDVGSIALPLGISFFTFQKLALLIDIRRDQVDDVRPLDYLIFVTFFPQLIAGPIVLFPEVHDQFRDKGVIGVTIERLTVGLTIFAFGLAKKIVLADKMAGLATPVFQAAEAGRLLTSGEAWTGALAYSLQLYLDFSAYSDMAIGLAWMFGIALPVNFNSPYKSRSIIEFWRRWHITLSRFLKVYLYIPLGGNRQGSIRRHVNLLMVMVLGGLWHGAAWTFVAWGALHGCYLMVNHGWHAVAARLPPPRDGWMSKAGAAAAWAVTFIAVVAAWVPFRADSFKAALSILDTMAALPRPFPAGTMIPDPGSALVWLLGCLAFVLLSPNTREVMGRSFPSAAHGPKLDAAAPSRVAWQATPAWSVGVALCLALGLLGLANPQVFIYFQF